MAEPESLESAARSDYSRAIMNILEDVEEEKHQLGDSQRAVLNILEDVEEERTNLSDTQRAVLSILEDLQQERQVLDDLNVQLVVENSERAAAEKALQGRTEDLARSNADLERFAYIASHDLQTPARSIAQMAQILLEELPTEALNEESTEYLSVLIESAERMRAQILGILGLARLQTDRDSFGLVDLDSLVPRLQAENAEAVAAAEARVEYSPLGSVVGDGVQLYLVLQNLLTNAIKYRSVDRQPIVLFSAGDLADEQTMHLQVSDNGIGIPSVQRDKVFDMFHRLHPQSDKQFSGSGMGLTLVQRIVHNHGGRVYLTDSPLGSGVSVHVVLPRKVG